MINKRKVRLMTSTAMYEKLECSNDINKPKYYNSDYVGLHMWTTAIAVTIAYIIIIMLVMSCNFEFIINNLTNMNYTVLTVMLIMIYAAMMTVFMIIAYFIYSYRYVESENGIRIYRNRLHKIYLMNKAERNRKGGIN